MNILILILVMGVVAVIVGIVLFTRFTKKEVKQIENDKQAAPTTHTFEVGHSHVNRRVEVNAHDQHRKGEHRRITVADNALPPMPDATPPPEKGIDSLIALVMNPSVHLSDTREEMLNFEPALDLMVEYTEDDVKNTTADDKGIPKLSLILGYSTDNGWKWERLKTRVDPAQPGGRGTLHAKLHTLHPHDPVFIGRP